jgi:hypothetical protein
MHLSGSVHQCLPFKFWHEAFQKIGIELGFPQLDLDVFEFQGEVIRVTSFYMACEQVVSD